MLILFSFQEVYNNTLYWLPHRKSTRNNFKTSWGNYGGMLFWAKNNRVLENPIKQRKGCTNSMPFKFLTYVFEPLHIKSRQSRVYHQFRRNCISSRRSLVYHHCESYFYTHLKVWWDTTTELPLLMIYSLTADDIPLLSQWIKKSTSRNLSIFWLGNRDSNPNKQSQSLSCYRYTIPQCNITYYILNFYFVKCFYLKYSCFLLICVIYYISSMGA